PRFVARTIPDMRSAAVNDFCDLPVLEREFRPALKIKNGTGRRSPRDVGGQRPTVGDACNGGILAEFQARHALLALGEQQPGLLCELPELRNSACCCGELIAGMVFEADIFGNKRK